MKYLLLLTFAVMCSTPALAFRIYSRTNTWVLPHMPNCKLYQTMFYFDPNTPEVTSDDRLLGSDLQVICNGTQNIVVPSDPSQIVIGDDGSIHVPLHVKWIPYGEYLILRKEKEGVLKIWAEEQGLSPVLEQEIRYISLTPN